MKIFEYLNFKNGIFNWVPYLFDRIDTVLYLPGFFFSFFCFWRTTEAKQTKKSERYRSTSWDKRRLIKNKAIKIKLNTDASTSSLFEFWSKWVVTVALAKFNLVFLFPFNLFGERLTAPLLFECASYNLIWNWHRPSTLRYFALLRYQSYLIFTFAPIQIKRFELHNKNRRIKITALKKPQTRLSPNLNLKQLTSTLEIISSFVQFASSANRINYSNLISHTPTNIRPLYPQLCVALGFVF